MKLLKKLKPTTLLSTTWIFLTLNYLYCDVLSFFEKETVEGVLAGDLNGIEFTPMFLLGAGAMMEVPMIMVVLSKVLGYKINKWLNIIAGAFMALIQIGSLFVGSGPAPHYIFFSVIEISTTLFIVYYAWNWKDVRS